MWLGTERIGYNCDVLDTFGFHNKTIQYNTISPTVVTYVYIDIEAGRWIGVETYGLHDVFPPWF